MFAACMQFSPTSTPKESSPASPQTSQSHQNKGQDVIPATQSDKIILQKK